MHWNAKTHPSQRLARICRIAAAFAIVFVFWDVKPVFYALWTPFTFIMGYSDPRRPTDDKLKGGKARRCYPPNWIYTVQCSLSDCVLLCRVVLPLVAGPVRVDSRHDLRLLPPLGGGLPAAHRQAGARAQGHRAQHHHRRSAFSHLLGSLTWVRGLPSDACGAVQWPCLYWWPGTRTSTSCRRPSTTSSIPTPGEPPPAVPLKLLCSMYQAPLY